MSVAAGDVQGAVIVVVVDSEETVVAGYWEGEDVAKDAVVAGDGESAEADDLAISRVSIGFGLQVFLSVPPFSLLLES